MPMRFSTSLPLGKRHVVLSYSGQGSPKKMVDFFRKQIGQGDAGIQTGQAKLRVVEQGRDLALRQRQTVLERELIGNDSPELAQTFDEPFESEVLLPLSPPEEELSDEPLSASAAFL